MEWISVKDRLPEPFQEVLVYGSRGRCGLANTQTDEVWRAAQWLGEVTHWMPLPEPPIEPTITITINVQTGEKREMTVDELTTLFQEAINRAYSYHG